MTTPDPRHLIETAIAYRRFGWCVVPVLPEAKRPGRGSPAAWRRLRDRQDLWLPASGEAPSFEASDGAGWQWLRLDEAAITEHLSPTANVGVNLGEPSGGLVDVDLDCPEAIELADLFLPETWTFGRRSKPRSHRMYLAPGALTEQFKTDGNDMLVELRATPPANEGMGLGGHQTVFPPSIHESGESVAWSEDFDGTDGPRVIDARELRALVASLAAAALMLRHSSRASVDVWLGGGSPPSLPSVVALLVRRWWGLRAAPAPVSGRPESTPDDRRRRATAYLARMPGAVSGAGGHQATFRAALVLVRGFELTESDAFEVLVSEFNARCDPPWSERELAHKVADALKSDIPLGYLLAEERKGGSHAG